MFSDPSRAKTEGLVEIREKPENIFRVQEFRLLESCFWFRQAGRAARFARRLYLSVRVLLQIFFRPVPFPFPCTIFPRSCAVRAAPSRFSRLFKIVVNSPGLLIETCKNHAFHGRGPENRASPPAAVCLQGRFAARGAARPVECSSSAFFTAVLFRSRLHPFFS